MGDWVEVGGTTLGYLDTEAETLFFRFPETPLRATYFARLACMLGIEDEALFNGALLWITLSDIGSPQLEKAGWSMVEMMRRSFGEMRPLQSAPGHWFRSDQLAELTAFVVACFVFGWDAYLIPSGREHFVQISHDECWDVAARSAKVLDALMPHLKDLPGLH
jgi:hypothetical protein